MKKVVLSKTQQTLLTKVTRASTSPQRLALRAHIILTGAERYNQTAIAKSAGIHREAVHRWLVRWQNASEELNHLEAQCRNQQLSEDLYQRAITAILADAPRPGAPATFTEEDKRKILALAAEEPGKAQVPITHWTHTLLAKAVVDRGIVPKISSSRVGIFLKESRVTTPSE
jgi:transposase